MDKTEFKKVVEKNPWHKIELLLPKDNAEESGIIIFADGAFQMISYAMIGYVGNKVLAEAVRSTDATWQSHQEMQHYLQERDFREITICMKKKHMGVLFEAEETVLDADSDSYSDKFFLFACEYISSVRNGQTGIALIVYIPRNEGEEDLVFFGHVPSQFYDLMESIAEKMRGEG
jgi:hypothetical protein